MWVDILSSEVHLLNRDTGAEQVLEVGQSAAAFHESGEILVACQDGFGVLDAAGNFRLIAEVEKAETSSRMNDGVWVIWRGRPFVVEPGITGSPANRSKVRLPE